MNRPVPPPIVNPPQRILGTALNSANADELVWVELPPVMRDSLRTTWGKRSGVRSFIFQLLLAGWTVLLSGWAAYRCSVVIKAIGGGMEQEGFDYQYWLFNGQLSCGQHCQAILTGTATVWLLVALPLLIAAVATWGRK